MGDREYNLKFARYWVKTCKDAYRWDKSGFQTKIVNFKLRCHAKDAYLSLAGYLVPYVTGEKEGHRMETVHIKARELCAKDLGNYEANCVFCGLLPELPYQR